MTTSAPGFIPTIASAEDLAPGEQILSGDASLSRSAVGDFYLVTVTGGAGQGCSTHSDAGAAVRDFLLRSGQSS